MNHHTIARELTIKAKPETVYTVVTDPRHIREWWPDHADLDARPGASGTVTFGEPDTADAKVVPLTVVEAEPPTRFSFRWAYPADEEPTDANSFLVTFELEARPDGTLLRFSETGFTDHGLADDDVEVTYADHAAAWDSFLPQLAGHAKSTAGTS